MTGVNRKLNWSFPRACVFVSVIVLLAIGLMFSTRNYAHPHDPFSCFGQLGTGFPVSFLCDYSAGGSPLSSAGKIDSEDFPYFSPMGTIVDMLFYSILMGLGWFIVSRFI